MINWKLFIFYLVNHLNTFSNKNEEKIKERIHLKKFELH